MIPQYLNALIVKMKQIVGGFMLSNTVFVMKSKKDSMRNRNFVCICVTDFFFDFGPGEVSARHTDFHSILVLLGGIFLSEQDARY